MNYAVNLALLISAVAGAWAAFAGETWRAADEPLHRLYRRVTRRGWIAPPGVNTSNVGNKAKDY